MVPRQPDGATYAGGVLEGYVKVQNPKESNARTLVLILKLKEKSRVWRWASHGQGGHMQAFDDHIDHIDEELVLWKSDSETKLPEGEAVALGCGFKALPIMLLVCSLAGPQILSTLLLLHCRCWVAGVLLLGR